MTPELKKAYDDSAIPFIQGGGSIGMPETEQHSWRYFLEINSACNLRCPTCTKGNMDGYDHKTGLMDMDLMERIIDKINAENPKALVLLYGNSEPFLHPKLPECIAAVKRRGLGVEVSTNLNYIHRVDEFLAARPDTAIVSLSGFTQDIYVRGHAGGKIDKVKANMAILAEANNRAAARVNVFVSYHIYNDNQHEIALMKEYAEGLGMIFYTTYARAISMENVVQYSRSLDPDATPFEVQSNRPDWNHALPPIGQTYIDAMKRLLIPPQQARKLYKGVPVHPVCPVGAGGMFTFIRHDGKTSMCACVADRRITVGDYLDTTPEEMMEQRVGHSFCKQCIKYRANLYFHNVDPEQRKTQPA